MTAKPKDEPAVDAEVIEDFKPSGAELVVSDPSDEREVFRVLDRHDEEQILSELQRRQLDVALYDFPQGGSRIVDLSYAGVNEAVREMNRTGKVKIHIDKSAFNGAGYDEREVSLDGEPHVQVTVYAVDDVTGYGQFGRATEPLRMKLTKARADKRRKDGKRVSDDDTLADEFAWTKALSKAQRNALKVFIPEMVRQTLIAQYTQDPERVKRIQIGAGAAEAAELPPALTDAEGEAKIIQARALYDDIRAVAPGGVAVNLLPGRFHMMLSKSWGSHAALDEFLNFLRAALEKAESEAA